MTYRQCDSLMNDPEFKKIYKNFFNDVNKKWGLKLSIWKYHKKNGKEGILINFLIWCWRNTLNTHPHCFYLLVILYKKFTGNEFKIKNSLYYRAELKKLFSFIDENWELFFTENIETKFFHMFARSCNRSWVKGQLTSLSVLLIIHSLFPDLKILSVECDLERGNMDDFLGKDIIFKTEDKTYSIQIKSGSGYLDNTNNTYVVNSSVNDLQAHCDFYCFVNILKNKTEFILFKNDINKIEKRGSETIFKKETFIMEKTENLEVTQKLMEIAKLCVEKKVLFNLVRSESENKIEFILEPEKTFNVTIGDFKDESLLPTLEEKFINLNNLTK